uniref:Uncharacterized protein n=1 Tax=Ditylenchus dipsaci TaxID=166011 RepID=A0A915CYT4_9BILA
MQRGNGEPVSPKLDTSYRFPKKFVRMHDQSHMRLIDRRQLESREQCDRAILRKIDLPSAVRTERQEKQCMLQCDVVANDALLTHRLQTALVLEDGHSMVSASSHSDSTLIDITSQRSNATTNASQSQQQYRK